MQAVRSLCAQATRSHHALLRGSSGCVAMPRICSASTKAAPMTMHRASLATPRTAHARYFSATPTSQNANGSQGSEDDQVSEPVEGAKFIAYEAPFATILGMLKKVSIGSCAVTLVSVPLLTMFGNPDMDVVHRVAVGCVAAAAAIGTTGALHKVGSPYVKTIVANDNATGGVSLELHTFTLFGRPMMTVIDDMETQLVPAPERAWASFRDTKSNKYFYVHEEWDESMFFDRDIFDRIVAISGSHKVDDAKAE